MRALILGIAVGIALAAVSAQAGPFAPKSPAIEVGAAPLFELVAQGCGWSWHRIHWRDRWGYWHWGHCVPNLALKLGFLRRFTGYD